MSPQIRALEKAKSSGNFSSLSQTEYEQDEEEDALEEEAQGGINIFRRINPLQIFGKTFLFTQMQNNSRKYRRLSRKQVRNCFFFNYSSQNTNPCRQGPVEPQVKKVKM